MNNYFDNPVKEAKDKEYERRIDEMVCRLYSLIPEEIAGDV